MRTHIYADESGNFDFTNGPGASRYFILASVAVTGHAAETALLELRRELAWAGEPLPAGFHATNDKQRVRDRVFAIIARHNFRVDATILEKRKANPRTRATAARFYRFAWYTHLAGLAPALSSTSDELLVIAAAIGTGDMRTGLYSEIGIAERNIAPASSIRAAMWPAATSPLLQVADYCAWALRRKWERADNRAYDLINDKIATEYDVFQRGTTTYY